MKHPTVAWFLAMTMEFLEFVGIDRTKVRFRQHAGSEMAHYASDAGTASLWESMVGWKL